MKLRLLKLVKKIFAGMIKSRIMIVENDWLFAKTVQEGLEERGYTVVANVAKGEVAIVQVKQKKPNLILMDVKLDGEMDGLDAAELIHNRFNIPVIFLTALPTEKVIQLAKSSESFDYLHKEFDWKELILIIENAIKSHRKKPS